jgi:ferredoxin/predicted CopG family antitoxin
MSEEERTINVNQRAYDKLTWARKKDESYSDVIIRLVSTKLDGLQRRGEMELVTRDNKRLILSVEQSLCMGAESCVALAPEVFALDTSQMNKAPLGMREVMDRELPSDKILAAAETCPYKAIRVKDAESGEDLFP